MKIDGEGDCWLTIQQIETDPVGRHDIRAAVAVSGQGYSGANHSVWFDGNAIAMFISKLRQLETAREGIATLESMSPGECVITFRHSDPLGHLALYTSIARGTGDNRSLCQLSFQFDPSVFPEIVSELERVLTA